MAESGTKLPASGRGPLVAVLGGGQLGRMLALAGLPLGLRFRFLEPKSEPPVRDLGQLIRTPYDDPEGLDALVDGAAVVTYEFENVPVGAARKLAESVPVFPPPEALEMAQDRLTEKESFRFLGIDTASFRAVGTRGELDEAVREIGLPAVLKTRRMGYDGKGQVVLRDQSDLDAGWEALGDRPLILEDFVDFRRELSILAVRSRSGETAFYPVVENDHRDGILVRSRVPAGPALEGTGSSSAVPSEEEGDHSVWSLPPQAEAEGIATRILDHLSYVGVLAVELFEVPDPERGARLLANEMAPRVHNSGHWTQDGAWTCQFENHLRAVLGLPLGDTGLRGESAAMINLLGAPPAREELARVPGARLHLYDKEPRPGRKVGHVNVTAGGGSGPGLRADPSGDPMDLAERVRRIRELVDGSDG